jgi:hypothetical protein
MQHTSLDGHATVRPVLVAVHAIAKQLKQARDVVVVLIRDAVLVEVRNQTVGGLQLCVNHRWNMRVATAQQ